MDEYKHVASMAQAQGIEFELLSPAEAKTRHPFLELHDLQGALWDPYDGDIDPSQLTQAYAKGAKDLGCRIQRFTRVTALTQKPDGGWRITTDKGEVEAEVVVNAAGYRAGEIMAMVGQYLPIVSLEHQYLLTESDSRADGAQDAPAAAPRSRRQLLPPPGARCAAARAL